jgi:signal transduction histidine kinase
MAVMHGHRLAGWAATVGFFAGHIGLEILLGRGAPITVNEGATFGAWFLVVLIAAEVARVRRDRVIQVERSREEEARHRATEERLRIARELHDVFAHNISLINVQAGVALHLMDQQPEQARSSLTAIKEASRDALRELRSTLGVLRQVDEDAPRAPAPSLSRLDELTTGATAAGLTVDVRVTGARRPIPSGADLAAYRIIQEALTNIARHSDSSEAAVSVDYGTDALTLVIEDNGRSIPLTRSIDEGHGIQGMRERAAALGGELEAGPKSGGGFRVMGRLPLDGSGSTDAGIGE